jgi:hypothetical protein
MVTGWWGCLSSAIRGPVSPNSPVSPTCPPMGLFPTHTPSAIPCPTPSFPLPPLPMHACHKWGQMLMFLCVCLFHNAQYMLNPKPLFHNARHMLCKRVCVYASLCVHTTLTHAPWHTRTLSLIHTHTHIHTGAH